MRTTISIIIKELATENFKLYPENYLASLEDAKNAVVSLAEGYFENRNETEVKRDEQANVELAEYVDWCAAAYCFWLSDQDEMDDFETVEELFQWAGQDLSVTCNFDRDLATAKIFHPAFEFTEHTSLNFNFTILNNKKFDSVIDFNYCEPV